MLFFFKQKTAYEMRISDWSSDVCSSDLAVRIDALQRRHIGGERQLAEFLRLVDDDLVDTNLRDGEKIILAGGETFEPLLQSFLQPLEPLARTAVLAVDLASQVFLALKSEGRRVGKECISKCRSRW